MSRHAIAQLGTLSYSATAQMLFERRHAENALGDTWCMLWWQSAAGCDLTVRLHIGSIVFARGLLHCLHRDILHGRITVIERSAERLNRLGRFDFTKRIGCRESHVDIFIAVDCGG